MKTYSVKKLAQIAGISIRTLHLYDEIGLLKPFTRTEARYRLYGEKELLRLQQILFYKELDFSLQEIGNILDDPEFDLIKALESHKVALKTRQDRISTLLVTIEKTISKIKGSTMITDEELYAGLPKEKAEAYRSEAIEKWGKETIEKSENYLRSLGKEEFKRLGEESKLIWEKLFALKDRDPVSAEVQTLISQHYSNVRIFWGTGHTVDKQAEAYKGLGQLFINDERYTLIDGRPNPDFAMFLSKAMAFFADNSLK